MKKCLLCYLIGGILSIIALMNDKTALILLLLPGVILVLTGCIISIVFAFKTDLSPEKLQNINTFLVKNDTIKPRKKDGNIQKGDVKLCFADDVFKIVQGEEIIENKIQSIRYLDIWKYEGDIYFKIAMRSHTEYIFKNTKDELSIISEFLKKNNIEIQDNRFND